MNTTHSPHTPLMDETRPQSCQYSPVSPSGTETVSERPSCGPTQLPVPLMTTRPAATTLPSTSTPPSRIYSMCTPPRKRHCPSNALTEPPRRNDDPVIQAIARMEARMQQELQRLRADVEGLHRRLDELTNSTAAHAREEERRSGALQQELKDGMQIFNNNMEVRRRRIRQASSILDELLSGPVGEG